MNELPIESKIAKPNKTLLECYKLFQDLSNESNLIIDMAIDKKAQIKASIFKTLKSTTDYVIIVCSDVKNKVGINVSCTYGLISNEETDNEIRKIASDFVFVFMNALMNNYQNNPDLIKGLTGIYSKIISQTFQKQFVDQCIKMRNQFISCNVDTKFLLELLNDQCNAFLNDDENFKNINFQDEKLASLHSQMEAILLDINAIKNEK